MTIESSLIHVAHAGHANPDATFFIAGAASFVSSTASLLREAGVTGANIRQDKYLGYKPAARQEVAGHRSHVGAATAP